MSGYSNGFWSKLDKSAIWTVVGILLLFSTSIIVTLIAPQYVDPSWTEPSSNYQVQMHEIADPNLYINAAAKGSEVLEFVYHLVKGHTLLAFVEEPHLRIISSKELEPYITKMGHSPLKLTSRLLLLKKANSGTFAEEAEKLQHQLQQNWENEHPDWVKRKLSKPYFDILELYDPALDEAFAVAETDGVVEHWVDKNFHIIDPQKHHDYHFNPGVLYVKNPKEYRVTQYNIGKIIGWKYDANGKPISSVAALKSPEMGFLSREELIRMGEHIYAIEGCWYCHTDQSRTLIQDSVVNGSDSYPAPPSSANEYIYNRITFPGTRRIGPDIARVGIKRQSRDWHKAHFWAPKTASAGSIMPAFRHFFDNDPRGSSKNPYGVPNYQFEAIFQYLMTKGTRITPPTQAWWLGEDPIQTIEIIDGIRHSGVWRESK